MSAKSFRRASCHVLDKREVADFTHKIFNLFDGDGDAFLNFEEFTLAVEVKDTTGNPLGKLAWLFDNVYDKVSRTFLTWTSTKLEFLNIVKDSKFQNVLLVSTNLSKNQGIFSQNFCPSLYKEVKSKK